MVEVEFIVETLVTVVLICYYILEGMVKAVLPAKYLSNKDISKDTVLVTGAGSGIGRALSISLAKLGCTLILWDINEEGNQETAAEIKRFGGQAHPYTVDVSKKDQVYAVADKVLEEAGKVDILVNNAGIVNARSLTDCPDDAIQRTLNINALAHFWTTKAFLPAMIDRDHGHVVAISSCAGLYSVSRTTDYSASKCAVVGFMESLMLEMKSLKKCIGTTVVCPFVVKTPLTAGFDLNFKFPNVTKCLTADYVAQRTVEAIQLNQTMLCVPRFIYWLAALRRILPEKAYLAVFGYFGFHDPIRDKGETTE